jgi:hypothetical protein
MDGDRIPFSVRLRSDTTTPIRYSSRLGSSAAHPLGISGAPVLSAATGGVTSRPAAEAAEAGARSHVTTTWSCRDGLGGLPTVASRSDLISNDYVFGQLGERTFSRRESVELPSGQVRLPLSLAKLLLDRHCPGGSPRLRSTPRRLFKPSLAQQDFNRASPQAVTREHVGRVAELSAGGRQGAMPERRPCQARVEAVASCWTPPDHACPDCVPTFRGRQGARIAVDRPARGGEDRWSRGR